MATETSCAGCGETFFPRTGFNRDKKRYCNRCYEETGTQGRSGRKTVGRWIAVTGITIVSGLVAITVAHALSARGYGEHAGPHGAAAEFWFIYTGRLACLFRQV